MTKINIAFVQYKEQVEVGQFCFYITLCLKTIKQPAKSAVHHVVHNVCQNQKEKQERLEGRAVMISDYNTIIVAY